MEADSGIAITEHYHRAEGKSSITTFRAVYYMAKVTLSFLINRIRRFG